MITANPQLDFTARQPSLWYLAEGAAWFPCIGNPEGVIPANKRALAASDDGNLYYKTTDLVSTGWVALGAGGGGGTVTSVGLTAPADLFVSPVVGSPVTTTGTLALALASQTANRVFASPDAVPGTPTFRALVANDIPSLNFSKITAGIVPVGQGGTGQNLGAVAAGQVLIGASLGVFTVAQMVPGNANEIPYNGGGGLFAASNEFLFDPLTASLQIGKLAGNSGKLQLFGSAGNSVVLGVNAPAAQTILFPDALPSDSTRFLKVASIVGTTTQLEYAVPSASVSFANPSALVGLSTVNGAATTAMRSDAAPPLSQAIAPTWTQDHFWSGASANRIAVGLNANTNPVFRVNTNIASQATGIEIIGRAAGAGVTVQALSSGSIENLVLAGKGSTSNVTLPGGNAYNEPGVQLGAFAGFGFHQNAGGGWAQWRANNCAVAAGAFALLANCPVAWGPSTVTPIDNPSGQDTAFYRAGTAGVIRVAGGALSVMTAAGKVGAAQNGFTAQGFIHSEPDNSSFPAYYANLPSGSTQNIFTGNLNNSARIAVTSTGKIQNNQNGVAAVRTVGQYICDVTDRNNSGTSQTDLFTRALEANLLGTNTDSLLARFSINFAANANPKQVTCEFGSETVFDTGAQAFNGEQAWLEVLIARVSSTVQKVVAKWQDSTGLLASVGPTVTYTDTTQDLTTIITLKTTGDGGATNDITNKLGLIVINPA